MELPFGRRTIYDGECVHRRADTALRGSHFLGRLRTLGSGYDVRRAARDVRGVWTQQIHVHRRDSVDAEQFVAIADLASLRLLPGAVRRLFWDEESHGPRTRAVFL